VVERVRVEERLERVAQTDWQRLTYGHPALHWQLLQSLAAGYARPYALRLFLLEDGHELVGAATAELITSSRHNAIDRMLFGRGARLLQRLGLGTQPALLLRTPYGNELALLVRADNEAERRRRLGVLLDGIDAHARAHALGVAVTGVFADDAPLQAALSERGYGYAEINPTTRLSLAWCDFDGYVRHLRARSKNAADTARKERRRNLASGVVIRPLECTRADAEELDALTRAHYRHKNGHDPVYAPAFMPQLAATLGGDFLVFEAVRDGRRVGMLAGVRSGEVAWLAWIGLALADRKNDFTYANLCFYRMMDFTASLGLTTLHYGAIASEAKRRRGCDIIGSRLYYRPYRRLLRWGLPPYLRLHRLWFGRKLG
jgi:predicted N-acyltransferase